MKKTISSFLFVILALGLGITSCNNNKTPPNTVPVTSLDGRIKMYFPYEWKQDIPSKYPDIVLGMSKSPFDLVWVFSYNKQTSPDFKGLNDTAAEDLKGKQEKLNATVLKPISEGSLGKNKTIKYAYSIKNGPVELAHNVSTLETECCFIYIDAISKAENFATSEKEIEKILKNTQIENPAEIHDAKLLEDNQNKNVYLVGTIENFTATPDLQGSWGWQIKLDDGKIIPLGGFINSAEINNLMGKKALVFGNLYFGKLGENKNEAYRLDIVSAMALKK
ncbi:hypothetical protein K1X76_02155 [bacterium]|nr:hypothetical protein [bacterium]